MVAVRIACCHIPMQRKSSLMNVVPGEVEGATQPEKASNFKGGKKHM